MPSQMTIGSTKLVHQMKFTSLQNSHDKCQVMDDHNLQSNNTKAKAMVVLANRISVNTSLPSFIPIGDADVPFVSYVKNLGFNNPGFQSQHVTTDT